MRLATGYQNQNKKKEWHHWKLSQGGYVCAVGDKMPNFHLALLQQFSFTCWVRDG